MTAAKVGDLKRGLSRLTVFFIAVLVLALSLGCTSGQGEARLPGTPLSLAYDAATGTLWGTSSEGIYRRGDGAGWKQVSAVAQGAAKPIRVTADPHAGDRLYQTGPGIGVMRSDDAGKTWRQIGDGLPSKDVGTFAVNSVQEGTLFAWIQGQGLFRTMDAGATWLRMDDGPPATVVDLVHSPLEGSMNTGWLYALTPQGIYLSMDCF